MRQFLKILFIFSVYTPILAQNHEYGRQVANEYKLGLESYDAEKYDKALVHFEKCITIDSTCFEAFIGIAQINFEKGIYEDALATCIKGARIRPNDATLFGIEGKSNLELGNYELAEDQLKKAYSLGDSTTENAISLARAFTHTKKYSDAQFYFSKLDREERNTIKFWYYRGKLYEMMEQYDKAKSDYEKALEMVPAHANTSIRLVNTLVHLKEFEEIPAIVEAAQANILSTTEEINLHLVYGFYYQQNKQFELAEEEYNKAYSIKSNHIPTLIYYTALYIEQGEYQKAVDKCNIIIEIDPESQVAYFNRGIANEMLRNLDQACADWEEAFFLGSEQAVEYLNGPVCSE